MTNPYAILICLFSQIFSDFSSSIPNTSKNFKNIPLISVYSSFLFFTETNVKKTTSSISTTAASKMTNDSIIKGKRDDQQFVDDTKRNKKFRMIRNVQFHVG